MHALYYFQVQKDELECRVRELENALDKGKFDTDRKLTTQQQEYEKKIQVRICFH